MLAAKSDDDDSPPPSSRQVSIRQPLAARVHMLDFLRHHFGTTPQQILDHIKSSQRFRNAPDTPEALAPYLPDIISSCEVARALLAFASGFKCATGLPARGLTVALFGLAFHFDKRPKDVHRVVGYAPARPPNALMEMPREHSQWVMYAMKDNTHIPRLQIQPLGPGWRMFGKESYNRKVAPLDRTARVTLTVHHQGFLVGPEDQLAFRGPKRRCKDNVWRARGEEGYDDSEEEDDDDDPDGSIEGRSDSDDDYDSQGGSAEDDDVAVDPAWDAARDAEIVAIQAAVAGPGDAKHKRKAVEAVLREGRANKRKGKGKPKGPALAGGKKRKPQPGEPGATHAPKRHRPAQGQAKPPAAQAAPAVPEGHIAVNPTMHISEFACISMLSLLPVETAARQLEGVMTVRQVQDIAREMARIERAKGKASEKISREGLAAIEQSGSAICHTHRARGGSKQAVVQGVPVFHGIREEMLHCFDLFPLFERLLEAQEQAQPASAQPAYSAEEPASIRENMRYKQQHLAQGISVADGRAMQQVLLDVTGKTMDNRGEVLRWFGPPFLAPIPQGTRFVASVNRHGYAIVVCRDILHIVEQDKAVRRKLCINYARGLRVEVEEFEVREDPPITREEAMHMAGMEHTELAAEWNRLAETHLFVGDLCLREHIQREAGPTFRTVLASERVFKWAQGKDKTVEELKARHLEVEPGCSGVIVALEPIHLSRMCDGVFGDKYGNNKVHASDCWLANRNYPAVQVPNAIGTRKLNLRQGMPCEVPTSLLDWCRRPSACCPLCKNR